MAQSSRSHGTLNRLPTTLGIVVVVVLMVVGCANTRRDCNPGADSEAQEKGTMKLLLTFREPPQLTAIIINTTAAPAGVLKNTNIMPCGLMLVDQADQVIASMDQRAIMKFRADPEPWEYVTIEPGAEDTIQTAAFTARDDGGFDLKWGPFLYFGLKTGTYTATATIVSDETAASGMPGAWRGNLVSEPVSFTLSAAR